MAKNNDQQRRGEARTPWYRSLQFKILVTLLVITTLILVGFAAFNVSREQARLEGELERLAKTSVERLSKQLINPLWNLNRDQVVESISAAMLERRIFAIIVREEDRETIYAGLQRGSDWQVAETDEEPQGDLINSTKTLLHDDSEMVGELEVYVTRKFMREQAQNLLIGEIQRAGALYFAFIIVMLILLQRVVVGPISRLTHASEQIAAGHLATRVDVESRDEIGSLGNAIDKLQTSLRIAMDRMKKD